MRLHGKVAIVTGASRGIGRAVCVGLAREGAQVVVNFRSREHEANAVVDEIAKSGGRAIAVKADVSYSADVDRLIQAAVAKFGNVHILINNAAITHLHKPWLEITEKEWDRVMAVNIKSCFLCFRAAYPFMRDAGWGRVVNISSVTIWLGRADLLHYVTAKSGMIGFTRSLARAVGSEGITVNAITPGAIRTESELEQFPDQRSAGVFLEQVQAVKRRGEPEDIVGAVVFLASDEAAFVTGQTINVDGGWAMH